MKTSKLDLLTSLIIETGLIEYSEFTEKEKYIIRLLLNKFDNKNEILKNDELLVTTEINKLIQVIKTLIVKSKRLDTVLLENKKMATELKQLKTKFQKEIIAEKQVLLNFDEGVIPLNMMLFSVRATKVLNALNINTINDLNKITKNELISIDNIGRKTINEIVDKAAEVGINIK
jgi:hypothetical protein